VRQAGAKRTTHGRIPASVGNTCSCPVARDGAIAQHDPGICRYEHEGAPDDRGHGVPNPSRRFDPDTHRFATNFHRGAHLQRDHHHDRNKHTDWDCEGFRHSDAHFQRDAHR
jgi:hypothetical protein